MDNEYLDIIDDINYNNYLLEIINNTIDGYLNPQQYYETGERYDIEDVNGAPIELKDIDFNILSNKDKYEIYKELIKLYKYFYEYVIDISNYE